MIDISVGVLSSLTSPPRRPSAAVPTLLDLFATTPPLSSIHSFRYPVYIYISPLLGHNRSPTFSIAHSQTQPLAFSLSLPVAGFERHPNVSIAIGKWNPYRSRCHGDSAPAQLWPSPRYVPLALGCRWVLLLLLSASPCRTLPYTPRLTSAGFRSSSLCNTTLFRHRIQPGCPPFCRHPVLALSNQNNNTSYMSGSNNNVSFLSIRG